MADVAGEEILGAGIGTSDGSQSFDVRADGELVVIGPQGAQFFFKMRADASPGPGYVVWVVTGAPDFAGTSAPAPFVPGTVVHVSTWT